MLAAGDDSWLQRQVAVRQLPRADTEPRGQVVERDVRLQAQLHILFRRCDDEAGKILRGILVHVFGRKKRDVEISRRETEGPAFVVAQDFHVCGVTEFALRAAHTTEAMVVGGDSHGPVSGN